MSARMAAVRVLALRPLTVLACASAAIALGLMVDVQRAEPAGSADKPAAGLPVKELVEYRTERSKTFEVPGRGAMTRFYGQPVHYDSGKNGLQPIRNTLVPSPLPGYAVRNQANAFRVDLPERLSDPVRFGGDGNWVRFGLRGASARAAVAGGGVRYDDALEATDVEYELRPTGLKETLVLKSRAAAAPAVFDVDISEGLEPDVRVDGSIAFRDGDKSVFGFAAPFMVDADGAHSSDVSVELVRVADAWRLTLAPSSAWIDDPAREFPVRLDPTIIWRWPYGRLIDAPADTFVSAATPATNYGASEVNDVGASGTATRRALLRYQVTEPLPWDRRVYSARFAAFAEWKDGTVGAPVTARPLTAAFTEWAATWNNRDTGLAWAAPGGDFTADDGAPAPRQTIQVTNQWYFWDFRQMTDDWLSRRRAEHGFMLRGDEVAGTTPSTIFHFSSAETADQSREPYLDVFSERMVGARDVDSFVELTPTSVESMYGTTPATAPAVNVNPATGNLLVHTNDAPAGTEGPISLLLDRFYNSGTASSTNRFGKGWSPGLDGFYLQADTVEGNVVFWGPSDEAYAFTRRPDGTFAPIDAADSAATLVREASGNYVVALAGQRFVFPCLDCGATSYVDASGATAALHYEGQQRAQTIQTSAGTTRLKDTAAGLAYEAVTPTGAVHRYDYTSDHRLSRHTAPGNVVTTYGYDANGRLNEIRQPNGQLLRFTYAWTLGGWRIETMTWVTDPATGTGTTTTFAYSFDTTGCQPGAVVRSVQTRPDGQTVTYCVDASREVISMKSSAPESPAVDDLAIPDYAEHLGVTQAVAKALLEVQRRADDLPEAVTDTSSGPGYAGVWFDEASRREKLGLKAGTPTAGAQQAINTLGIAGSTDIVTVSHTQRELENARDALSTQIDDLIVQGKVSTNFETDTNSVGVELASTITAGERSRVNQAVASISPVRATVHNTSEPSLLPVLEKSCYLGACDGELRGGQHFVPGLSESGCTTGFNAQAADGRRYVITAGHCLRQSITNYTVGWRGPNRLIGYPHRSATSPHEGARGDFGLLGINELSPFYPRVLSNWVNVDRSPDDPRGRSSYDETYVITKVNRAHRNHVMCFSGTNGGPSCGIIGHSGRQEGTVRNLGSYFPFKCNHSVGGDSGGPYFKGHAAKGIHYGRRGQCTQLFSGAREAEDHLNVKILTLPIAAPPS